MFTDNPSYFSLSGESGPPTRVEDPSGSIETRGFAAFFRKKTVKMGTTASASALSQHESISSGEECQPMLNRHLNNTTGPRRSFRSLFRSISANAENEKTLQILKGDPRPSDVAPPSPYLPHRSHSHSDHDRKNRPNRRRVLKSASELLSNDMIFCGLPGEEPTNIRVNGEPENDDDDDDDTAEVFLGVDDARYYNLTTIVPASASRRHSIGTFLVAENGPTRRTVIQTENFIREPDTIAPPIPIDQIDGGNSLRDNRKCRKHTSKKGKIMIKFNYNILLI